ncbi:hypothetical protein LY28_01367 [Ruminiclostridium sufflavum DSM 19573]|uniref:TadE-like protein n=1 Tax=Ruminiclostridium sufflavum DSM 19573 TaxID=1121337 RepID=A0A318XLL7_9FIRM|nr:TadE family protein [Ruminiclostridium sufflavum]PYG88518.1 hypothetical protein LY28_01367 [Ruminiclostridium sufflavum DSM 19573]
MSLALNTKKIYINKKGSLTAETSIVFSVVFLLTAALIYIFILMYQYAVLQSIVNEAANIGSCYYCKQFCDEYGYSVNNNLYWRIYDKSSEEKKAALNQYISERLKKSVFNSQIKSDICISDKFLLKQISASLEAQYRLPAGNCLEIFGLPSTICIKAEANSPLHDKAEFVRNLDIINDIEKCIANSDNKWIGKDSQVSTVLDKLFKSR